MKISIVLLIAASCAPVFAQTAAQYHVTHTWAPGGEGRWDYVAPDEANHRLFIARQNRLMVVNTGSGKLMGEVTGINGAHGSAIGAWIRHLGQRSIDCDVRREDLENADAHSRC